MPEKQSTVGRKLALGAIMCAFVGGLIVFMAKEQQARSASQQALNELEQVIAAGDTLTDEEVHERLGREPDVTRKPVRHRLVEEYRWSGGTGTQTLYVYYMTAAAKLLTAVSLNEQIPEWEATDQ